ncbi:hypothetical protein MKK70_22985 [Methylobacterium sp. E-041]|uniref:hypothetical protein n=1 Tax=Methylobacterium sp. E-041 TaxID=2836573 RepID=UPI001FBB572A|nr:hypothetical protein [Methylobacterium sp. E-041]MCJ2108180.1 hypothetical protein [Methylobacterium sp. E-041]
MRSGRDQNAEASQSVEGADLRERLTRWGTFALLLIFFIFTIALWGYAAWWGVVKLIQLVF